jgi:hypothetical protein
MNDVNSDYVLKITYIGSGILIILLTFIQFLIFADQNVCANKDFCFEGYICIFCFSIGFVHIYLGTIFGGDKNDS